MNAENSDSKKIILNEKKKKKQYTKGNQIMNYK